jgi:phosphocarrier protein
MNRSTPKIKSKAGAQTKRICKASVVVPNGIGLHARPALMLVKLTQSYEAGIVLGYKGRRVSAKSIMGVLTLCAEQGAKITVTAEGRDASAGICAIKALFACSFREDAPAPVPELRGMKRNTADAGRGIGEVAYIPAQASASD